MPQYLEFASSQRNRSPRTTFSRRTLGAFPVAVRNPGPERSYEAPDNFPAPGLLLVSPVVTGASASVGALLVLSFRPSLGAGCFGKAETPIRHSDW